MTTATAACGTYSGYQRHIRSGEQACVECRQALREYMSEYRRRNPAMVTKANRRQYARERALRRLAAQHHAELESLIREELARVAQ